MTKRAEQNKLRSTADGVALEHNTVYDDNLLPAADELCKLNALDSDIVPWVMKRTEIEQDARIKFNLRLPKDCLRQSFFAYRTLYCSFQRLFSFILFFSIYIATFAVRDMELVAGYVCLHGKLTLS